MRLTNDELRAALDGLDQRLEHLAGQQVEVNKRLERLYEALETGALSLEDLAPRIKELRDRQEVLRQSEGEAREAAHAQHVELISREDVLSYMRDLRGTLATGVPSEQGAFLKSFVSSVTVREGQVAVAYVTARDPGLCSGW